jgi:3',5'-cyclic AMP phosphodiesterase CpdA
MHEGSEKALSANPLIFAHVSDLHLPHEPQLTWAQRFSKRQLSVTSWRRRRRAVQRPEILEALREELRTHDPDHVVVTGDITNFSLPAEFAQAASWLGDLAPAGALSAVPGNHDALVPVPHAEGLGQLTAYMTDEDGWPYVRRSGQVAFIGLKSALPTAPLLATGRIGEQQLARLEKVLEEQGVAGSTRVVLLHHPPVDGAVSRRKALVDRAALRSVLRRAGAELVLHGHARNARLDSVPGPHGPIPVLCVPSSSAWPNPHDEAARWHLVSLPGPGDARWAQVKVRQWSPAAKGFVDAASYELRLPEVH